MTDDELAWVRAEFTRCEPWIQAALDKSLGEYEIDHVLLYLASGKAQIWPTPNACMITLIEEYPTGLRMLKGWLSGGELDEIKQNEPKIRDWAKRAKCDVVVIGGRRGWLRAFDGYREAYTVIARKLT